MIMAGMGDHKPTKEQGLFIVGNNSSGAGLLSSSCVLASTKRSKTGAATFVGTVSVSPSPSSPLPPPCSRERKDKIGERVAALQQLVSPYGKTDTASVLQEATGYIKFLHEQVQVYSLRSRGLCLVPLECTATLPSSNGADLWAPTNTITATTTTVNTCSPRF